MSGRAEDEQDLSGTVVEGQSVRFSEAPPACVAVLEGHSKSCKLLLLSPDGGTLYSGGNDGVLCAWRAQDFAFLGALEPTGGPAAAAPAILCAALSADGCALFCGYEDGSARAWDAGAAAGGSSECLAVLRGHAGAVHALAPLTLPTASLVTGGADGTLRVWRLEPQAACVAVLEGHTGPVFGLALRVRPAPQLPILFSASHDATLRCWDLSAMDAGVPLRACGVLSGHDYGLNAALQLSPCGLHLYSCSNDASVRKWDTRSGACVAVLKGHSRSVTALALSADGSALYSGAADGDVRAWRARDGSPRLRLSGHKGGVYALALSTPGGGALFSAGYDDTVRGWHAHDGSPLALLRGHSNLVSSLLLSPDGSTLFSASADTTVRAWNVPVLPALPPFAPLPAPPPQPSVSAAESAAGAEIGQLAAFVSAMSTALPSVSPTAMVTLKAGRDGKTRVIAAQKAVQAAPVTAAVQLSPPTSPMKSAAAAEVPLPAPTARSVPPAAPGGGSVGPILAAAPAPAAVSHSTLLGGGTLRPRDALSPARLAAPPSGGCSSPTYAQYKPVAGEAVTFALGTQGAPGEAQGVSGVGLDFAARVAEAQSRRYTTLYTPGVQPLVEQPAAATAPAAENYSGMAPAVADGNGCSENDFVARITRARSSGALSTGSTGTGPACN